MSGSQTGRRSSPAGRARGCGIVAGPHPVGGAARLPYPPPRGKPAAIMSIDASTVRRVARLARIAVPEGRLEPLAQELSGILAWIEQLGEVDTEGVAPMTSCVSAHLPLRDDVVTDGEKRHAVLSNAPKAIGGFFVVPKVVE